MVHKQKHIRGLGIGPCPKSLNFTQDIYNRTKLRNKLGGKEGFSEK